MVYILLSFYYNFNITLNSINCR